MTQQSQTLNASEVTSWISDQLKPTMDFVHKPLHINDKQIVLLYIKTVVDGQQLQEIIIKPFFELQSLADVNAYLTSLPSQQETQSKEQVLEELTKGSVAIAIHDTILLYDFKKVHTDTALISNNEPTIQGPQYALSEDLATNLNIIRQRYHRPSLYIETYTIGDKNKQALGLLYDGEAVDQTILDEIRSRIEKLNHAVIQSSSELQRYLNKRKRSLVPNIMITERTDRIVYNLAGGKIILLLDGNSIAIIAPAVFFDFMNSMEDNYHPYWITKFMQILRYIGLVTCLSFPGLYVAVTSYNPDVLRADLALSIAGSRIGVPYPAFVEVMFMLLVMELLTEASIRLPKSISATATTVGGLILGTAVTEANLTSNIMIIIVSAVAISTFVIPINDMSFAIRVFRYVILLFATFTGLMGLVLGLIGFVMYLTNKRSFGEPFFKLFIQNKNEELRGSK